MKLTFWGVRGSIPAPGPETMRYGGNTPCIELRGPDDELYIIDSGTGIIPLGRRLMQESFGRGQGKATLFLSHSHWDHIQGFPFFGPVFIPGNQILIVGPGHSPGMLEKILEGQMNPHYSPLQSIRNLGATLDLKVIDSNDDSPPLDLGPLTVAARKNPNGRTTALAYRFNLGGKSIAYACEAGYPTGRPSDEVRKIYAGVDLLIHDATYSPEDRAQRLSRGFASIHEAVDAAIVARCKTLVLFRYDQDYTDDFVDELTLRARGMLDSRGGRDIALVPAREGLSLEL